MTYVQMRLFELQDLGYRDFHSGLMPSVEKARIIGVRTPTLRRLAVEIYGSDEAERFLNSLPHRYYEEDNLHAFLIERISDYARLMDALEKFLPYVDNWATCDMMSPMLFKNPPNHLENQLRIWMEAREEYTVRFSVVTLMKRYLGERFLPEHLEWVADIRRDEYYIKMAVAWYFATALALRWEDTLPFFTENRLDEWTHNKTLRKACESCRLTEGRKSYLKTLRRSESANKE